GRSARDHELEYFSQPDLPTTGYSAMQYAAPPGSPTPAIRTLDIPDLERIARFRHAGYGGSVSDALGSLGVKHTVFSDRFRPLRQGMQLVGRALPIKLHSLVEPLAPEQQRELEAEWQARG